MTIPRLLLLVLLLAACGHSTPTVPDEAPPAVVGYWARTDETLASSTNSDFAVLSYVSWWAFGHDPDRHAHQPGTAPQQFREVIEDREGEQRST